jgi:hypothetical protein
MVFGALVLAVIIAGTALVAALDHKERKTNAESFRAALRDLENNPQNRHCEGRFLETVAALKLSVPDQLLATATALAIFARRLEDGELRLAFLRFFQRFARDQFLYRGALESIANEPSPQLRQFALQMARLHYASMRENAVLTVYDEQAIQNDLLVTFGK